MKKKRMTAWAMAILTAMSLAGGPVLAESADNTTAATTTTTGRVTAVSAESITMELGEWTQGVTPQRGADASSSATVKPETSAAPETTAAPDTSAAPDDGAAQATPAQGGSSDAPQDGQSNPPQDGQPSAPQDGQGNPPQDGQPSAPQGGQENPQPSQETQRGSSTFTANGETLTFKITESTAFSFRGRGMKGSLSDITVGAILTVTLNGDAATSVTILQTAGSGGRGFFGNFGSDGDRFSQNTPGRNHDGMGQQGGIRRNDGFGWNNRGPQGGDNGARGRNPCDNGPQNFGNGICPRCNPGQNGGANNQAPDANGANQSPGA